jgi:hypothetical protein
VEAVPRVARKILTGTLRMTATDVDTLDTFDSTFNVAQTRPIPWPPPESVPDLRMPVHITRLRRFGRRVDNKYIR